MSEAIAEFWNKQSCGEAYASGDSLSEQLRNQAKTRYQLEPYIRDFARFEDGKGKDVLEIGVGMGADHLEWAKAGPCKLIGVDLTERAVKFTRERLALEGFVPDVTGANAECISFPTNSFDIVYSWGVLHHCSNPVRAINEVFRVLKPEGYARLMIYHKWSITGLMLWLRYGLGFRTLRSVFAKHLESPCTHAYSVREARKMLVDFALITIRCELGPSDLLEGAAGQRHEGFLLSLARSVWPRRLLLRFAGFGLFMLIEARKPPYKERVPGI